MLIILEEITMAERLYPQLSVASEDTKLNQELKEEKSRHRLPTPPPAYCMLNANSNPNANPNANQFSPNETSTHGKLSASAPNASLVDSDDEDYILFTESSINEPKPAGRPKYLAHELKGASCGRNFIFPLRVSTDPSPTRTTKSKIAETKQNLY
jgi:hypothetical protein